MSAKDKATGKEQQIRIQSSGGLSDKEIEQMKADAEKHAQADAEVKAKTESRNTADSICYDVEKNLSEHGEKISTTSRDELKAEVTKVRAVMENGSADEIKEAYNKLQQLQIKCFSEVYKNVKQDDKPQDDGKDGAQDAEFKEKK